MRLIVTIIILIASSFWMNAQNIELPVETDIYPFIRYEKDRIEFCNDSTSFERLFYKLDTILIYGKGKISIVHFGGSHIQADIYTNKMREYMQNLCRDCNAGRGLVTPYKIAQTNNPYNYSVSYNGDWEYGNIVKKKHGLDYGISGLTIFQKSDSASIKIDPNVRNGGQYHFDEVKIFHTAPFPISVQMVPDTVKHIIYTDSLMGLTNINLSSSLSELGLLFTRKDISIDTVQIFGLSLENKDPGIIYHTIGINGAGLQKYLDAKHLPSHLKTLEPDLFIISVGTNDANTRYFKPEVYAQRYRTFLDSISNACPDAAILLTVPNDSWLFKKYINENTEKVKQQIFKLSCEYNAGVWDFYTIMGGLNSISYWYDEDMARPDRIHFSRKGYELKGDLFFNSFLRAYNNHIHYIESQNANLNN